MCESLSKGDIDCALLLTEGAVKYCLEKRDCLLYGVYVQSPLNWGVHAGAKSTFNDVHFSAKEVTFAISRFGSGSHLMAFVLAKQMGWTKLKFEVIGNLKGAQDYLTKHPDTLFMWEKAMTDPLVKQNVFKRIGETPTPWPCFVLCVRKEGVNLSKLEAVCTLVRKECAAFKRDKTRSIDHVHAKFGIERHLVEEWFSKLEFSLEKGFDRNGLKMLGHVKNTLIEIEQLPRSMRDVDVTEITLTLRDPQSKL